MPKLSPHDKSGGSRPDRLRGEAVFGGLHKSKSKSHPSVQDSSSLDSEETNQSEDRSHDGLGEATSVSSYEQGLPSLETDTSTTPRQSRPTSKIEFHASQLQRRLRRATLTVSKLRWPRMTSNDGGTNAASSANRQWLPGATSNPVSRSPVRSESSSTTSDGDQGKDNAEEPPATLNSNKGLSRNKRGEINRGRTKTHLPRTGTAEHRGMSSSCNEISMPLQAIWSKAWRRLLHRRDDSEEFRDPKIPPVSGTGRSTAGRLENVLYGWLGGVVGRSWPGMGLALLPMYHQEYNLQVHHCILGFASYFAYRQCTLLQKVHHCILEFASYFAYRQCSLLQKVHHCILRFASYFAYRQC